MTPHVWTDRERREKDTQPAPPVAAVTDPAAAWVELQRSLGNQAVCRLVEASRQPVSVQREVDAKKLNVVGEDHAKSEDRRKLERDTLTAQFAFSKDQYWIETDFTYGEKQAPGDDPKLRMLHSAVMLYKDLGVAKETIADDVRKSDDPRGDLEVLLTELQTAVARAVELKLELIRTKRVDASTKLAISAFEVVSGFADPSAMAAEALAEATKSLAVSPESSAASSTSSDPGPATEKFAKRIKALQATYDTADQPVGGGPTAKSKKDELTKKARGARDSLMDALDMAIEDAQTDLDEALLAADYDIEAVGVDPLDKQLTTERSEHMHKAAEQAAGGGKLGVWMVGALHLPDLEKEGKRSYTLTTEDEFNAQLELPTNVPEKKS